MPEVVIIGGGASGLLASIMIKENLGNLVNVTILERLERVGKKILATGSGKANFTNHQVSSKNYNQPRFVAPLLKRFGYEKTLHYFDHLGLSSIVLTEGRTYPKSESANSLLDALRNKMRDLGVEEKCNAEVKRIIVDKENGGYLVELGRGTRIHADALVLATGGAASPVLGSNGTGLQLAKSLKIKTTPIYPGLVGVKVDANDIKGLEGLRIKARVLLYAKRYKEAVWQNDGEIQFKADTVSGIVIMDMASQIARSEIIDLYHPTHFVLDFFPEATLEDVEANLVERQKNLYNYSNAQYLIGMFQKMMALNILKRAKIDVAGYVKDLTKKEITRLAKILKEFTITYKGLDSFDHAQVTVGGVNVNEVVSNTLEAKNYKNLYFCGEILDIDGDCGGYNLQWAWTSAFVVAEAISKRMQE